MSKLKILLLGRTGLLGSEFFKLLGSEKAFELSAPSHGELELLDFERTQAYIKGLEPDLIIHCVAYTNVEKAEEDREACHMINVELLANILKCEIPIIHFSTDYVFDVEGFESIPEAMDQHPINYYGESKRDAELLLQGYGNNWWNIRTSWLFGDSKKHFIAKILDKAQQHPKLQVVDDQIGRPTYAKDLADFVVEHFLLKFSSSQVLKSGHYHIQNSGAPISWADLAEFAVKEKGLSTQIERVDSEHYPTKAQRPKNSILENTKLPDMRPWKDAVREYLNSMEE